MIGVIYNMKNNSDMFKTGSVPQVVMKNIVPSIISMIMVLVYNLADTFFIGQTNNAYMVAAISLGTPVFILFMAIGMLFGIGGTSFISRKLGEGHYDLAQHISSFCFWSGLGIGVIACIFVNIAIDPICYLIGATPGTFEYVKQYVRIVSFGIPFLIVSNSYSNIIRAEGMATLSMLGMIIGNFTNIILDPIMILGFGWNISGAALATVIGNVFATLFYMKHLLSKKSMLSIDPRKYKIGEGVAIGVIAIGVPASVNTILMSASNIVVNNFMTEYGDMAVAGLGVAMKVNMIAVMLLIGVGTGIQPVLGYCYGAGDRKRFLDVLKISLAFAFGLSLVMSAICYLGASPMVDAFISEPEAAEYGMIFARTLIISGPILGLLFVFINTLQAMGAAIPSLVLSVARQGFVYIPILITFSIIFDSARMLALAQPVADYFAVIMAFVLFLISFKKLFNEQVCGEVKQ